MALKVSRVAAQNAAPSEVARDVVLNEAVREVVLNAAQNAAALMVAMAEASLFLQLPSDRVHASASRRACSAAPGVPADLRVEAPDELSLPSVECQVLRVQAREWMLFQSAAPVSVHSAGAD